MDDATVITPSARKQTRHVMIVAAILFYWVIHAIVQVVAIRRERPSVIVFMCLLVLPVWGLQWWLSLRPAKVSKGLRPPARAAVTVAGSIALTWLTALQTWFLITQSKAQLRLSDPSITIVAAASLLLSTFLLGWMLPRLTRQRVMALLAWLSLGFLILLQACIYLAMVERGRLDAMEGWHAPWHDTYIRMASLSCYVLFASGALCTLLWWRFRKLDAERPDFPGPEDDPK